MNVLSLFDGMSCGRIALERAGIKVDKYFACEIDPYAIQIAKKNYPDTKHLGDVTLLNSRNLPKIDILIGGSPCQGFSFAGKRLNFDDPRSKLFFEYVRILKEVKPKYFLLENVKMSKDSQDIISEYLGVRPIEINSALVSAQNRKRLYWTNIEGVEQPKDEKILLKDVVGKDSHWFYQRPRGKNEGGIKPNKTGSLTKSYWEHNNFVVCMHNLYGGFGEKENRTFIEKSPTIRTASGGGHIPSLLHSDKALKYMDRKIKSGRTHWDFGHNSDMKKEKSQCVVANFFKGVPYNVLKDGDMIRKFHPVECERLQTVPDGYTEGVSNTQRYRMIGNGWTISVISHILKNIKQSEG